VRARWGRSDYPGAWADQGLPCGRRGGACAARVDLEIARASLWRLWARRVRQVDAVYILGGLTPASAGTVVIDGKDLALMSNGSGRTCARRPWGSSSRSTTCCRAVGGGQHQDRGVHWRAVYNIYAGVCGGAEAAGDRRPAEAQAAGAQWRQQQRVAIARGIVNQPAILLADEPTGNLDSQNSTAVLKVMKDLNERTGQTI